MGQRQVLRDLVDHQHVLQAGVEPGEIRSWQAVVLGQPTVDDADSCLSRLSRCLGGNCLRTLEPGHKPGWGVRIVVDALIVDHETVGQPACLAEPDTAQETVFEGDEWQAVMLRVAACKPRVSLASPANNEIAG
jgi:hypothetical protein